MRLWNTQDCKTDASTLALRAPDAALPKADRSGSRQLSESG
jgi:hypothetical protein